MFRMKKKSSSAAGLHAHAGKDSSTTTKKKGRKGAISDQQNVSSSVMTIKENKKNGLSNVVYIGHIPHGFYEKQMKEFFSQFGHVSHVRLSRNKKTGKSKHYGFLQFLSVDVAEIVADAMNGYHFFGQKLEVKVMNKADVHPEIFKGANRVFKRIPWREIETKRHNKERTEEEEEARKQRVQRANRKRAKSIAAAGIEYSYELDESNSIEKKEIKRVAKNSRHGGGVTKMKQASRAVLEKEAKESPPALKKKKATTAKARDGNDSEQKKTGKRSASVTKIPAASEGVPQRVTRSRARATKEKA